MQKNTSFYRNSPQDRGVALLFALGILAALMLLGIAFMGSSLFSRRISENRNNATDATTLARSTANLVAAAVENYRNAIANLPEAPSDYRMVFSVGDLGKHDKHDEYGEFLRGYSIDSIANRIFSKLDVSHRTSYHGNDSGAQWVYVRTRDDDSANGRIIGRYAFQVLPAMGYGRINLGRTLRGKCEKMPTEPGSPVESETKPQTYNVTPHDARWGWTTAELNFDPCSNLKVLDFPTGEEEFIPARLEDLYAAGIIFSNNKQVKTSKVGRAWMAATFIEGNNPGFREAAPGNHLRFNLAPVKTSSGGDAWYSRFSGGKAIANKDQLLEELTEQVEWESAVFDYSTVLFRGLPFLRYIGDSSASFGSLSDLRHQIAANLNDYCDEDSIPTSDKTDAWAPGNAPSYTGNEKTLYINELMLGGMLNFRRDAAELTLSSTDSELGLCVELIAVYDELTSNGYKLKSEVTGSSEVVVLPTLTVPSYTYSVKEPEQAEPVAKSGSNYVCDSLSSQDLDSCDGGAAKPVQEITWIGAAGDTDVSFDNLQNGYAVGAKQTSRLNADTRWNYSGDGVKEAVLKKLEEKLQADNNGKSVSDVKITSPLQLTSVRVKLQKVRITLGSEGIALLNGTENADYVRTQPIEVDESTETAFTPSTFAYSFMIGGMEAKDPRQNLNVSGNASDRKRGTTGNSWLKSDWVWDPILVTLHDGSQMPSAAHASLSGNVGTPGNAGSLVSTLANLTGSVNSEASPSGTISSDRDKETVNDPAWRGDTKNDHISTAVIRNAPMLSPWELGFIHRGVQFQTINLKGAADSPDDIPNGWTGNGTNYSEGDGGILDWIQMTDANYSDGKINLNQFGKERTTGGLTDNRNQVRYLTMGDNTVFDADKESLWATLDKELLTALFANLSYDDASTFVKTGNLSGIKLTAAQAESIASTLYDSLHQEIGINKLLEVRSEVLEIMDWSTLNTVEQTTDAAQEEIIGRTINLLTAKAEAPTVFRAVVVAQSIKDLGGNGGKIQVLSSDHPKEDMDDAEIGSFDGKFGKSDPRDNVHYDIISGEAKLLVTYEWNPATGKVIVRDIETIE